MRTPTLFRRRLLRPVAVLAVAGAVALAGCGGSSSSPSSSRDPADSLAAILASTQKTVDAGSARMVVRVELSGAQDATLTLDGAFDAENGAAEFDVAVEGEGLPTGGDLQVAIRLVDGALYVDASELGGLSGLFGGALPGSAGAKWWKLDLAALGGTSATGGSDPTGGLGSLGSDPAQLLQALQGAGDVEVKGTEEVRGTETTHYRVMIDPAKAIAQLPADEQADLSEALSGLSSEPIPADLWIDDDGLLRKMTLSLAADGSQSLSLTLELFDFGERVSVQAPPADETTDLSGVLGGLLSDLGSDLLPGSAD